MRASTNIDLKNRKAYELTDFRGVDFSSPVSKVSPTRATTMRNMICEGGINHKRPGWERLFQIPITAKSGEEYGGRINGIFPYGDHLVVHSGKHLYKVQINADGVYEATHIMQVEDRKSQGFYQGWALFVVGCGGGMFRWNGYKFEKVFDNAYIPTTTISIDADSVVDTVRETLEGVNLMTGWRKNKMRVSSGLTKDKYAWTVDTGRIGVYAYATDGEYYICTGGNQYKQVSVTIDTVSNGKLVQIKLETPASNYSNISLHVANLTVKYVREYRTNQLVADQNEANIRADTSSVELLGNETTVTGFGKGDVVGYVNYESGRIILGKKYNTATHTNSEDDYLDVTISEIVPGSFGEDCIQAQFYCLDKDKYDAQHKCDANGCQFGTLFGVDGSNDTLFLSGNPEYPNMEYHSAPGDFTYFPDRNYTVYGSTDVPIVGYGRVSDTILAVFKKENYKEPTVYYRTGEYKTIDGNLQEIYPITAGAMGKGIVSRHGCAYFHGDPLILTSEGVYGLSLGSNIAVNERYAKERSANIRKKLVKADLENAVGIVYGDRYYLATGNECYVADSRNKFSQNDSYGYEWWYWDNIPARVWAVVDGELWFGTEDGSVCRFDNQYTDRTHISTKAGDLSIDVTTGHITFKQSLPIRDDMLFRWLTDNIYSVVAEDCTVSDGMILSTEEEIMHIHDGTEVYAKEVGSSGLTQNTKYYICNIDRGELTYQLRDKSGNVISLASGGFSLHEKISQKTLYVRDCDDTGKIFRLAAYEGGPALTLSYYLSSAPSSPLAIVTDAQNVVAEWCTPALDFGTNMHVKTLLRMTIAAEPVPHGKVVFGYETRTASRMMARMVDAQSVGGFSLEDFSFEDFSFNTDFAGSYTVRCNERNFNYIMFHIKSDSATDCAVSGLSVLYKINRSNKGVK